MEEKKLPIKEEFIRLDSALKLSGLVFTGGHAKLEIQDGKVQVNGEPCTIRGKKLYKGDRFSYHGACFVIE